jgi:hypothetical protein
MDEVWFRTKCIPRHVHLGQGIAVWKDSKLEIGRRLEIRSLFGSSQCCVWCCIMQRKEELTRKLCQLKAFVPKPKPEA